MPVRSNPKLLHPIEASALHARRERVFLVIAGLFLGTLAMLNILGILRFIKFGEIQTEQWGPLFIAVAIGVLPYPVTFLCTDLICELYGRARANAVVWVGLLLNAWVLLILWIGGILPGFETIDAATGTIATDAAGAFPRVLRSPCLRLRSNLRLHGRLPHGTVHGRVVVPLLEETHTWSASLAAKQRIHAGKSVDRHGRRGAHHMVAWGVRRHDD
jgi:hypothetical protein